MLHTKPIKILLSTAGDKLGELVRDLPEVADSAVVAEATGRLAAVQTALAEGEQLLSAGSESVHASSSTAKLSAGEKAVLDRIKGDTDFGEETTEEGARKRLEAKKAETA